MGPRKGSTKDFGQKKGNIDLIYRNIVKLVEAKRRLGKRTPVICWQYFAFGA